MCLKIATEKQISRSENGRSLIIRNNLRWEIGIVQVDGCLINDDSKRCDWMIRFPSQKKISKGITSAKLVEFKGSNIPKAFLQLEATLNHPVMVNDRPFINECFIVSKISPSFSGTVQEGKLNFRRKFNLSVQVGGTAKMDAEKP